MAAMTCTLQAYANVQKCINQRGECKKKKRTAYKKHSNPYLLLQEVNNIWQRKMQGTVGGEQWLPDEMHDGQRDAYKC